MTHINCIPPSELTDKQLLAEYCDIPKVFHDSKDAPDSPKQYTIGKGHIKFFYDKLHWLAERQVMIAYEMRKRGYKTNYDPAKIGEYRFTKPMLWGQWTPTKEALEINREKLNGK